MEDAMAAANMTFRVDTDLRDEFFAVAQNQRVPASQVLRELMRGYVAKNKHLISDAERAKRADAESGAIAST
jgi:antitoxin component of RelBE/YafQ-DinJ toxin-antitoxin module